MTLVIFQLHSATEVRSCGREARQMVPVPATTQVWPHYYDCSTALNFFFGHFPISGRCIMFSIFTFSVLCFFYLYSCLLHVFSYNITPPQFWPSYLSVSIHFSIFHILITTSSLVFLSTWPCHLCLALKFVIFFLLEDCLGTE